ncbi:Ribonuclease J [Candidatus Xenohaliotis californiensis]|uniref:Ribonuclease J n=1 Tax=Candidatus Xenohaliotis californiensis TaxID=84677 RepID=A0ABP0ERK8_9RICK|nr:Ribonuclease J [Candidatus Xenohaliotis californiensis]
MLNFNKYDNNLLFLPLGGSGEVGMNVNLYQYKGEWIMVDLGVGFANDYMPGIEVIVPDISFIAKRRKNLKAIILTHAHEDHYGAVPLLWEELRCPIYATKFTAECLRTKLESYGMIKSVPITEIPENGSFKIGEFDLEFVNMTHSIPEMNGLIIKTDEGVVFHTGDWKLDENPVIGNVSNINRLKQIGDNGVLAMICDSTNVMREGHSGSEGSLTEHFHKIISEAKQLVAVALFASNVARIDLISRVAMKLGRKIAISGRSLLRIIGVAQSCGYLQGIEFCDIKSCSGIPRNKLLLLCTGCQGEKLAAMNRIIDGSLDSDITLNEGDCVIFSSKIIPGNEHRIFRLFNKLALRGINLITEYTHDVHVSGHPCKDELKAMYDIIKPNILVPVHGEHIHILEHQKMAENHGIKEVIKLHNGCVLNLSPGKPEVVGQVQIGYFGVDMNMLLHPEEDVMRMRRIMSVAGVVFASVVLSSSMDLIKTPSVIAPGVLDRSKDADIFHKITHEIESSMVKRKPHNTENAIKVIKLAIRAVCRSEINKEPYVYAHIDII